MFPIIHYLLWVGVNATKSSRWINHSIVVKASANYEVILLHPFSISIWCQTKICLFDGIEPSTFQFQATAVTARPEHNPRK